MTSVNYLCNGIKKQGDLQPTTLRLILSNLKSPHYDPSLKCFKNIDPLEYSIRISLLLLWKRTGCTVHSVSQVLKRLGSRPPRTHSATALTSRIFRQVTNDCNVCNLCACVLESIPTTKRNPPAVLPSCPNILRTRTR